MKPHRTIGIALAALGAIVACIMFFNGPSGTPDVLAFRTLPYAEQLAKIKSLAQADPKGAWQFLIKAGMKEGEVVIDAHGMGHVVGNAMYEKYGLAGIRFCTNEFAYACMHGVTEKLFATKGPGSITDVEKTCTDYFAQGESKDGNKFSGCIHGAGHGLLSYYAYDVPRTLRSCETFSENVRGYCYDGTFMEAAQGSPESRKSFASDAWLFCKNVPEAALHACSRYLPVALSAVVVDGTPPETAALVAACAQAPRSDEVRWCTETVGHMIAQHDHAQPETIKTECGKVAGAPRDICLAAAATEMGFQGYQGWHETAHLLCSAIKDTSISPNCESDAERAGTREGRP